MSPPAASVTAPTPFYKLSGAGNDFVALVEPAQLPSSEQIRRWCSRRTALGADGLFVIGRRSEEETDSDGGERRADSATVRMHHFNSDGSRAELCGNGTRCAAKLAFHLGWAEREVALATDSGLLRASLRDDGSIRIQTPPPPRPPERVDLATLLAPLREARAGALPIEDAWRVTVGVPHLVVLVTPGEEVEAFDVAATGPVLRSHPLLGDAGANVDYLFRDGETGVLDLRTWERGVEGETLACGSGAVATALVLRSAGVQELPIALRVRSGELLRIGEEQARCDRGRPPGSGGRLWQEGPATLVAHGHLLV